jgi:hypothetical protein
MKRLLALWITVLVFASIILSGCGSDEPTPEAGDGSDDLPPVAAVKAREALAADLGVDVEEVTLVSYERMDWTDSCLGLGGPAESCLAAIHPGWLVMLEVDGETYEVRTDELGEIIRIKE